MWCYVPIFDNAVKVKKFTKDPALVKKIMPIKAC